MGKLPCPTFNNLKDMYYNKSSALRIVGEQRELTEDDPDGQLVKPCKCNYFFHSECLYRRLFFVMDFNCPGCKRPFIPVKAPSKANQKAKEHILQLISGILLILIGITAVLTGTVVSFRRVFEFWKYILIVAGTGFALLGTTLIVFCWKKLRAHNPYTSAEWSTFLNFKEEGNKVRFLEEQPEDAVSLQNALFCYLKHTRKVLFSDVFDYKNERLLRMLLLRCSNRPLVVSYLSKYTPEPSRGSKQKSLFRWNSVGKKSGSISLEEQPKIPVRMSTLRNVLKIEEISDEGSHASIELDSFSDSSKNTDSEAHSVLEFSDDNINKLFNIGKYKKNKPTIADSSSDDKKGLRNETQLLANQGYTVEETEVPKKISRFKRKTRVD